VIARARDTRDVWHQLIDSERLTFAEPAATNLARQWPVTAFAVKTSIGFKSHEPRSASPIVASAAMTEVLQLAQRAAASDAKVLVTGESGAGKDIVAHHVHYHSSRRNAEFVAVNCAGITETLLESELFGHVKGSFTGAYRDKVGKLRMAHCGTLFLDEVGEMSLRMQALLLRFLENGEIQAVGSDAAHTTVDVRVIAATNRNLADLVGQGRFREDLLYRLRVIHLHVPPLRDRVEDIRPLAMHFFARSGRLVSLTDDAWTMLERYQWPGNVRELQNVVEQMTWLSASPSEPIGVDQVPAAVRPPIAGASATSASPLRERRRQIADELYQALTQGGYSFWQHIHPLFLNRDITRNDLRELLRRGLSATRGSYRATVDLFGIPSSDYKRFMNFLSTHDCRPDYREFRKANSELPRTRRPHAPLLPPLEHASAPDQTKFRGSDETRDQAP
jgi:DNA-binding NtrC family response regulator